MSRHSDSLGQVEILLFGNFDIRLPDGKSLRPDPSKARALLAILALSDEMQRPRKWLRNVLWSDRGEEQRAASLRQCLSELRKNFSAVPDAIYIDREVVRLNPHRVRPSFEKSSPEQGLLEDLWVRDPAFTQWLELERARRVTDKQRQSDLERADSERTAETEIVLICESRHDQRAMDIELQFEDSFSKCLSDFGTAILRPGHACGAPLEGARVVLVRAIASERDYATVRVVIDDVGANRRLWSDRSRIALPVPLTENSAFLSLCFRAADQAINVVTPGVPTSVAELAADGISKLFTIKRKNVSGSVTSFQQAIAADAKSVFYAWLAQALTIQYVECYVSPDAAFREMAEHYCRLAMEGGSGNSNVLAAVANARVNLNRNFDAGLVLGARSVQANPANPLAWWSYSNALVCVGESREAYRAALNAKVLAEKTRFSAWTELQVAVTAAMIGEQDVAIVAGESATALLPDFRPPLRYLSGLYALQGNAEALDRNLTLLTTLEPDFSLLRMIEDESYPVGIMRRYGKDFTDALKKHQ